jgi:hypothetical protein
MGVSGMSIAERVESNHHTTFPSASPELACPATFFFFAARYLLCFLAFARSLFLQRTSRYRYIMRHAGKHPRRSTMYTHTTHTTWVSWWASDVDLELSLDCNKHTARTLAKYLESLNKEEEEKCKKTPRLLSSSRRLYL